MSTDRAKLEAELAELEALFPTRSEQPQQVAPAAPNRAALEAELAELERLYPTKTGAAHRAGQLGRGLATAIGRDSDVTPIGNPLYGYPEDYEGVVAAPVPGIQMSEELPRALGLGQEYEPEADDTLGKVVKFGGEMLKPNEFLPFGGYGVVGNALGKGAGAVTKAAAKELGMMGAQAAAIKGTPRFTEEGGIPGAIEDIAKGFATTYGLSAAGKTASGIKNKLLNPDAKVLTSDEKAVSDLLIDKVGLDNVEGVLERLRNYHSSIGYKPLTAEIAENDALAQLYRAQVGIAGTGIGEAQASGANAIDSAIRNAKRGSDNISHTQDHVRGRTTELEGDFVKQIRELDSRSDVSETGRTVQKSLIENLKEKEQARRTPTKPMYESLDKNFSELEPKNALDVLNNTIVKGKVESDYNAIKKMLKPAKLTKGDIDYKKSYDKSIADMEATGYSKAAIEKFKNSTRPPKSTEPSVAELSATRKAINVMLDEAVESGNKTRHTMIKKVKDALDVDLQAVPEQRQADALFHELSGPVSEITDNKALRAVTKERYGKTMMSESRVPGVFINSSAGSIDDAKALLRQIHDKPDVMQAVRDHLHEKAIASIADPKTGMVTVERIEAFKNKYPGARILYPDLYNVKLQDISHATFAFNKYMEKTNAVQKTLERDAFHNLIGGDTRKIMPNIFHENNSAKNMKNMVEEVSQDSSGRALNGLKNESLDYFKKSISNRSKVGEHHELSYDKMRNFVDKHEKALETILEPNQMAVVKEVEKIVGGQNSANTRGATKKSDTNANLRNALDISSWSSGLIKASLLKIGVSTPFVKQFLKDMFQAKLNNREAILNRAITDTEYADFLMSTPLKSKKDALEFSEKMKHFNNHRYIPPILKDLATKEQSKKD